MKLFVICYRFEMNSHINIIFYKCIPLPIFMRNQNNCLIKWQDFESGLQKTNWVFCEFFVGFRIGSNANIQKPNQKTQFVLLGFCSSASNAYDMLTPFVAQMPEFYAFCLIFFSSGTEKSKWHELFIFITVFNQNWENLRFLLKF